MEKATQDLPIQYRPIGKLDLTKDTRALIWMNVLGFVLLILFGWLFAWIISLLRPGELPTSIGFHGNLLDIFRLVVLLIGSTALMILLHEGVHGFFFWVFTLARPHFAFKGWYAYAAAPGWYLPRAQYLVVGLAPLILISLVGVLMFKFVPAAWLFPMLILLVLNASGAVGDLIVVGWLLIQAPGVYAQDRGDSITLFRQENPSAQPAVNQAAESLNSKASPAEEQSDKDTEKVK